MSKKYQIIRIDNLTVRKMDLKIGDNIIGNDLDAEIEDNLIIEQAVKISVSPNGEIHITPFDGISCYIKSHGTLHWKLLRANWTVPLKVKDTCLIFPIKIWFKVICAMENPVETEGIRSPKRKLEENIENEPPDKKHCPQLNEEMISESSVCMFNKNNGVTNSVEECDLQKNESHVEIDILYNNSNNVQADESHTDINSHVTDSNLAQCSDFDINKSEQEKKELLVESKKEVNLESNKDVTQSSEIKNVNNQSNDGNLDQEPEQQNLEEEDIIRNVDNSTPVSDNSNQVPTASVQSVIREKCRYGDQCYRLNAEHKTKFSHPDDADYDVSDSRPECPYGIQCYRKNPQHKLDYKHTRSKRKPARPKSPNSQPDWVLWEDQSSEEESVDESDYDPSFIDDDDLESDFDDENDENE